MRGVPGDERKFGFISLKMKLGSRLSLHGRPCEKERKTPQKNVEGGEMMIAAWKER